MKSFLEYVCKRLMGPPISGSSWRCPFCDSSRASFSVRRPKLNYATDEYFPIKFRCFRCGKWGDEFDVIKLFHPGWSYSLRQLQLARMQREYESQQVNLASFSLRGGSINMKQQPQIPHDDPRDVELAWANLMEDFRDEETSVAFALQILTQFKDRCDWTKVSMDALLAYWKGFEDWIAESDQRHLAQCDDPNCEAIVCRAERGLLPLTPSEIESGRPQRNERVRNATRGVTPSSTRPKAIRASRSKRPGSA